LARPVAGNIVIISEITPIEMASVMTRRVRSGTLTAATEITLSRVFAFHVEKRYLVIPVKRMVLVSARNLVRRHGLRTLDAIQLASALRAVALLSETMIFVTSDIRLLGAAVAEGFLTDDPLLHP
jgi:hypothetical protein